MLSPRPDSPCHKPAPCVARSDPPHSGPERYRGHVVTKVTDEQPILVTVLEAARAPPTRGLCAGGEPGRAAIALTHGRQARAGGQGIPHIPMREHWGRGDVTSPA